MNMLLMTSGMGQSLGRTQHLGTALMPVSLSPLPTNGLKAACPHCLHPGSFAHALREHFPPQTPQARPATYPPRPPVPSSAQPPVLSLLGPPLLVGSFV